jgi:hypothetical protein
LLTVVTGVIAWLTNRSRQDAKGAATTAREHADSAERQANAAAEQAWLAKEQLELALAALPVDYRVVLIADSSTVSPEQRYDFLELEWRGATITLNNVVMLRGVGFNADGTHTDGSYVFREDAPGPTPESVPVPRPLTLANSGPLPMPLRQGEKVGFNWPGGQPGPSGFSGAVRVNYQVGSAPSADLDREVDIPGFSGFRYGD